MSDQNKTEKHEAKDYPTCENCGQRVDPFQCKDGYTPCCNELIVYPNDGAIDYSIKLY